MLLTPPLCHKLSHLLGPLPPRAWRTCMYFMDGPHLTMQQLHILQYTFRFYNCTNCDQLHVKICPAKMVLICHRFIFWWHRKVNPTDISIQRPYGLDTSRFAVNLDSSPTPPVWMEAKFKVLVRLRAEVSPRYQEANRIPHALYSTC